MKLLNTKSIIRYLPPKGTAGLARSLVSGPNRIPLPPARTMPNTRIRIGFMPYCSRVRVLRQTTNPLLSRGWAARPGGGAHAGRMTDVSQTGFATASVVGTGMMGPGIALTLALGGIRATLLSHTADRAAQGVAKARAQGRVARMDALARPDALPASNTCGLRELRTPGRGRARSGAARGGVCGVRPLQ